MPRSTADLTAKDLRRTILGARVYTAPSPMVLLPTDLIPKGNKRIATAARAMADSAQHLRDLEERAIDQEPGQSNRRQWERKSEEMASRLASGDKSADLSEVLPVHDPAQDLAVYETLLRAIKQARTLHEVNVQEYDEAIREVVPEILTDVAANVRADAEQALADLDQAAASAARALSSRDLALGLRAVEAVPRLLASGAKPQRGPNGSTHTVADQARTLAAATFSTRAGDVPTAALAALADGLRAVIAEDPSASWPVAKSATPRRQTMEEYRAEYARAVAMLRPPPPLPEHLGGMVTQTVGRTS